MVLRHWKNVGVNQEPFKGRVSEPVRVDRKPLLTRETKGNNASRPQKHGVRMANVTGLSWSLPVMVKTMWMDSPPRRVNQSSSNTKELKNPPKIMQHSEWWNNSKKVKFAPDLFINVFSVQLEQVGCLGVWEVHKRRTIKSTGAALYEYELAGWECHSTFLQNLGGSNSRSEIPPQRQEVKD